MTALVLWALRLVVLYIIMRIVFSVFHKKSFTVKQKPKTAPRFDAKGQPVEDADFKEL